MTKTILSFFIATVLFSSVSAQTNLSKYRIEGRVQGYPNGTKLYLHDVTDGSYKPIDSTIIVNDRFSFSGYIKTVYLKSGISTADFSDRVIFWLEKGQTSFLAGKGNFKKAIIEGTKIQGEQNKLNRQLDTAKNAEAVECLFIRNNPGSVISAYILSVYCSSWKKDTVSTLYNALSKDFKTTGYGKKVFDYLSLNRNLKIGDRYVDFAQKDTSNKWVKLSAFKGKVVLLEFWGSWCGPCREENPELVKIYNEFKANGFEILGVAAETDKRQWMNAIKTDGLTWTNVTDLKGGSNKAAMIYGVAGYPTNFLIDKTGIIIAREVYGEDLRNWLLKIL
jgi:thiol-disulfide isomerase/thioredoxin